MATPAKTTLSAWGGVEGSDKSITGWYTNAYIGMLVYLAVPILLASVSNLLGWTGAIWAILLVSTLADLWVIFYPWAPAGISIAGYIAGQAGGEAGLSVKDGVDKAEKWLKQVYSTAAVVILGKQVALIALVFLPLAGFGGIALAVLALTLLVIIGTVRYSESAWVIRSFWHLYIWILVILMGYWIIAGVFFPELRQSAAHSVVTSAQQTIRDQNDAHLQKEASKVAVKLAKMDQSLSEADRVARLSKEDQVIWGKAMGSSFAGKSIEALKPAVEKSLDKAKEAGEKTVDAIKSGKDKFPSAYAASSASTATSGAGTKITSTCTLMQEKIYSPSSVLGKEPLGTFPAGQYQVRADTLRQQAMYKSDFTKVLYTMDADGRMPEHGNHPWKAGNINPTIPQPFPGQSYGAFVLRVDNQPILIGSMGAITLNQETAIEADLNVFQAKDNYQGAGSIKVSISKC
ncbi:MAG: hypothetical protein ABI747_04735 [Candidatus Moraniibacteriota bacterium]